jgi:CHASE3 domain sensor protein
MDKMVKVIKKCWKPLLLILLLAILIGGSIYINKHSKVSIDVSQETTTQLETSDELETETKKNKGVNVEETAPNNDGWGPIS